MTTADDQATADFDIEMSLLMEAIHARFHYDFRDYAKASVRRRLRAALPRFGCRTLSQLQHRVLHEPNVFTELLEYLTVQVSDMFRDPAWFRLLREEVVPVLRTYPSLRVWVAGCSTGEEVWSLAILLREEGLLDRTLIYATDINVAALTKAEAGVYALDRVAGFTQNHRASGGRSSLSDHYSAAYGRAIFDKTLRQNVTFSDHSLATDSVFAEMHFVSCRNVMIYFGPTLQDRAVGLFSDSLCRRGFLGIGAKESLQFTAHGNRFAELRTSGRIYQKRAEVP